MEGQELGPALQQTPDCEREYVFFFNVFLVRFGCMIPDVVTCQVVTMCDRFNNSTRLIGSDSRKFLPITCCVPFLPLGSWDASGCNPL